MSENQPPDRRQDELPATLNYESPTDRNGPPSHRKQMATGFLFWIAGVALLMGSLWAASDAQSDAAVWCAVAIPSAAEIAVGIYYAIRKRWTMFIPGQLLGLGLTCLLPIGIVAVLCGNMKL